MGELHQVLVYKLIILIHSVYECEQRICQACQHAARLYFLIKTRLLVLSPSTPPPLHPSVSVASLLLSRRGGPASLILAFV